jgi:hypothetical protein
VRDAHVGDRLGVIDVHDAVAASAGDEPAVVDEPAGVALAPLPFGGEQARELLGAARGTGWW